MPRLDADLPVERHDIFDVMQLTRDTALGDVVAADLVDVEPAHSSRIHRHNNAETILYFLGGSADVVVGDEVVQVRRGDRLHIGKGVFHGVRTHGEGVQFLSVQSPPILNVHTGVFDLEPLDET